MLEKVIAHYKSYKTRKKISNITDGIIMQANPGRDLNCLVERQAIITIGGRFILFSACLAIGSLFMGWANVSFLFLPLTSKTGIAIGMIYILCIWIYPSYAAIKHKRLTTKTFILISLIALIVPFVLFDIIDHKRIFWVLDVDAGFGVVIFTLAGLTLVLGMIMDQLSYLLKYLHHVLKGLWSNKNSN
jgi:hypothetical protein